MKLSKVRRTDYRKPPATAGLDALSAVQAKEAGQHDKAVTGHATDTLLAMAADLGKRSVWDRRDPEHRWVMGRRAAVLRLLDRQHAFDS